MFKANISLAVTVVVVKSEVVELIIAVPLESDTPDVFMLFDTVGMAVPEAIFQNLTVQVPVSAVILYPVIVPAKGTTGYPPFCPVVIADPPPSTDHPTDLILLLAVVVVVSMFTPSIATTPAETRVSVVSEA